MNHETRYFANVQPSSSCSVSQPKHLLTIHFSVKHNLLKLYYGRIRSHHVCVSLKNSMQMVACLFGMSFLEHACLSIVLTDFNFRVLNKASETMDKARVSGL